MSRPPREQVWGSVVRVMQVGPAMIETDNGPRLVATVSLTTDEDARTYMLTVEQAAVLADELGRVIEWMRKQPTPALRGTAHLLPDARDRN